MPIGMFTIPILHLSVPGMTVTGSAATAASLAAAIAPPPAVAEGPAANGRCLRAAMRSTALNRHSWLGRNAIEH